MNLIDNFPKKIRFFRIFRSNVKKIVVFAFTFVLDIFGLFFDNFCMDLYSIDSDEARRWSIKRFIASIFKKRLTLHRFIATIF
jgi:hypothetical protein